MSKNILKEKELESIDMILDKIKKSMDNQSRKHATDVEVIELTDIVSEHHNDIADAIISDYDLNLISNYIQSFSQHLSNLKSKNYFMSEEEIKEVFKDALRPYLKSWLNNNITRIVKEILEQEIKKVFERLK
jgi:cell pole-organizing protein PopZ